MRWDEQTDPYRQPSDGGTVPFIPIGVMPSYPPAPTIFSVTLSASKTFLTIVIGFAGVLNERFFQKTNWVSIYFVPATQATTQTLLDPSKITDLVYTTGKWVMAIAVGGDGSARAGTTTDYLGVPGWWFAATEDSSASPVGPIPNPSLYGTYEIPGAMTGQTVSVTILPRSDSFVASDLLVSVSANAPASTSFAGYQIYMQNLFNRGVGYVVEGPFFPGVAGQSAITGSFKIPRDGNATGYNLSFYFVSKSLSGATIPDPLNSPFANYVTV